MVVLSCFWFVFTTTPRVANGDHREPLEKCAILTLGLFAAHTYAASPCPPDGEAEICQLKDVVEAIKKDSYTD